MTDQRLLETQGKSVLYDLALSKIAGTEVRHVVLTSDGDDVRYFCFVYSRGGPLRALRPRLQSDAAKTRLIRCLLNR